MTSFQIPSQPHTSETEVKRSRFICHLQHTKGVDEAKSFIQSIKQQYPDARHHCYGFIADSPNNSNSYGFSDDNEPTGTAGMPIFTHLKHSLLGETTVVVVRYFGGTKLGTGGLARAYGDAAKKAISEVIRKDYIGKKEILITCSFSMEDYARKKIEERNGEIISVQYQSNVHIEAAIPEACDLNFHHEIEVSLKSAIYREI